MTSARGCVLLQISSCHTPSGLCTLCLTCSLAVLSILKMSVWQQTWEFMLAGNSISLSLTSHTIRRERKGLVTLQPLSCYHGRNLMWPIRSAFFVDRIMSWSTVTSQQLVDVSIYYLIAMVNNCIPRRQLDSCSMIRPFISLRRVWLVRLHLTYKYLRTNLVTNMKR